MGKDIKKRTASHIYYGVHKETGELMHISQVSNGQKCNCICAACGQPFEARKGSIRRHHFAHVSNYECMYAEYDRICRSFDVNSEQRTVDRFNRRWILCEECSEIKQETQMAIYGGIGRINRGVCSSCSRKGRGD